MAQVAKAEESAAAMKSASLNKRIAEGTVKC